MEAPGPRCRRSSAKGASPFERRRREDQWGWVWETGVPLPTGRSLGKRLCPLPKNFFDFWAQKARFVQSGTDKTYLRSAWRLDFLASSRLGGGASPLTPPVNPPLVWVNIGYLGSSGKWRATYLFMDKRYERRKASDEKIKWDFGVRMVAAKRLGKRLKLVESILGISGELRVCGWGRLGLQ